MRRARFYFQRATCEHHPQARLRYSCVIVGCSNMTVVDWWATTRYSSVTMLHWNHISWLAYVMPYPSTFMLHLSLIISCKFERSLRLSCLLLVGTLCYFCMRSRYSIAGSTTWLVFSWWERKVRKSIKMENQNARNTLRRVAEQLILLANQGEGSEQQ